MAKAQTPASPNTPPAGSNAAVAAVAGAIADPEAHQAPTNPETGTPVPDPTPAPQQQQQQAPPQQQQGEPSNPPAKEQEGEPSPSPQAQNADELLASLTLDQLNTRLKELAGEEGVDENSVLAANVNASLAKARQQEKDKLYGQISQQKTELAAAQKVINDQAEALKNRGADPEGGTPTKPPANKEGEPSDGTITREQLDKALEIGLGKATEAYEAKVTELQAQLSVMEKNNQTSELAAHKNALIEANRGKIVEELISGNTKEELDNSVIVATQAYARLAQHFTQSGQAAAHTVPTVPPAPNLNPGAPAAPNAQAPEGLTVPKSLTDFGSNREAILAEASKAAKAGISNLGQV